MLIGRPEHSKNLIIKYNVKIDFKYVGKSISKYKSKLRPTFLN